MCKVLNLFVNLQLTLSVPIENGLLELDQGFELPETYPYYQIIKMLYFIYLRYAKQQALSEPLQLSKTNVQHSVMIIKILNRIHKVKFGGYVIENFKYKNGMVYFK